MHYPSHCSMYHCGQWFLIAWEQAGGGRITKEAREVRRARRLCFDAAHSVAHLQFSFNTYVNNMFTPIKLRCFFTLSSASMILAHTWLKLAANQIMIPASGIIDGCLSKQSLQPPRPTNPPTFRRLFFAPKPRLACLFFIVPRSTCEPVRRLGF